MKVFVVLSLALFSVCNANILWQQPPKTNLDMVKDAFWDYVARATQTAEDSINQIMQSEMGQNMNNMIGQSADAVNQYAVALRNQMSPLSTNFVERMSQEVELLKARMEKDLTNAGENIQPQVQQMLESLQRQVEELKERTTTYAESVDPEAVKAIVMEKTQELKTLLDKKVTDLQAQMVPITEQAKEKLDLSVVEFQKKLVPLAQNFETEVMQKTQELQQRLAQSGEQLRTQLDASTQNLQAQLTALWETFTQRTQ